MTTLPLFADRSALRRAALLIFLSSGLALVGGVSRASAQGDAGAAAPADPCRGACGAGTVCARAAFGRYACVAATAVAPATGAATAPTAPGSPRTSTGSRSTAARPDRQADGGLSLGFLAGGGYTFAHMPLDTAGGDGPRNGVSAQSHLGWMGGVFDLHYGFSEHVYLGFTLDAARVVNSDDSSGTATIASFGPSLLLRPARPFYVGVDVLLRYTSFDDLATSFTGATTGPDLDPEMDVEHAVGMAFRLRLGFVISVTDLFAITPELRFDAAPFAFAMEGADATDHLVGGVDGDASELITVSGGLVLGARLFL